MIWKPNVVKTCQEQININWWSIFILTARSPTWPQEGKSILYYVEMQLTILDFEWFSARLLSFDYVWLYWYFLMFIDVSVLSRPAWLYKSSRTTCPPAQGTGFCLLPRDWHRCWRKSRWPGRERWVWSVQKLQVLMFIIENGRYMPLYTEMTSYRDVCEGNYVYVSYIQSYISIDIWNW